MRVSWSTVYLLVTLGDTDAQAVENTLGLLFSLNTAHRGVFSVGGVLRVRF